jgi:selenide,water dikinase
MLPGYVAGVYKHEECHIDLVRLCAFAKVRMIHEEAQGLDISKKLVLLNNNRPSIRYDVLSIDIGCQPKPLSAEFSNGLFPLIPVKPIDSFSSRWTDLLNKILNQPINQSFHIVTVGGGAGGVELTFAIHHRLHKELRELGRDNGMIRMSIITRGARLLTTHSK